MMMTLATILAPASAMAFAFIYLLQAGVVAGEAGPHQKLGIGALAICIALMLAQALLWVMWGLYLGRLAA